MNTKKSPEPLLYIQQPEIEFPELDMQEIFMTKKTEGKCLLCDIVKNSNNSGRSEWIYSRKSDSEVLSVEKIKDLFSEADAAVSGPITLNNTDSTLERNSDGVRMNASIEGQNRESLSLNYDHHALQDMIAQYEMKRQFEIESRPLSSKRNHTLSLKKAKTFKEMDLDEKLEYLISFPKMLPPVPCIFTTGNRSIRGFLLSNIERKIDIKTFDEKLLTISIHELKDIQMIGMK